MLKHYPYFAPRPDRDGRPVPGPLSHTVERDVRFEEVDAMGVVWHGRYPSYFEDARVALGARFGIGYAVLAREKTPAPLKHLHIEYVTSLRFGQRCRITAALYWSEAARMNMAYTITMPDGTLCASGYSIQLFTTIDGGLLLEVPGFYSDFLRKWRNGDFKELRNEQENHGRA